MRAINARLRAIERRQEASKPLRPILVITSTQDAETELAKFRAVRGCEPERVFVIRRASARKGEHGTG